ncbi:hypothetical protein [Agrococcus beijingensis]|uniref:hypothetical protein n=1 Tax=Agrococcus beijingensis TaxID=3068634 RepID=UPI002740A3E6|nr:hypothetical protein [Agrococcus sp. REN33]
MSESEPGKRRLTRSPNYPSIDLARAIDRVRSLYSSERQHAMPALQAVRHWGYSSLNSPGGGQLAALTRFGLLDDEGSKDERKVRVTDLAVKILEHPDPEEREAATRSAALLPSVHRDMWNKYGPALPSEDNLRWFLTRERGFSQNGATDFIREYRATIDFANLNDQLPETAAARAETPEIGSEPGSATDRPSASQDPSPPVTNAPIASGAPSGQVPPISFPLASGKLVSVTGLSDLTESDWAQFIAVLTALKPSLVPSPGEARDTARQG